MEPSGLGKRTYEVSGSLEDGPKPEKAGTPEFYNHEARLQGDLKTNCEKFQVTELWRPVWVSHQHGALRLVFAV